MGDHTVTADPLTRFEAEHERALAALARLEQAITALERGEPSEPQLVVVREVLQVLTTEVRAHNDNEERALFPELGPDSPVWVFEEEHERLRALERDLALALESPTAARQVALPARELIDLLRAHIERENEVLFPWAREVLGEAGLAKVRAALGEP